MFEKLSEKIDILAEFLYQDLVFENVSIFTFLLIFTIVTFCLLSFFHIKLKDTEKFINDTFISSIKKPLIIFMLFLCISFIIEIPFFYLKGDYINFLFSKSRKILVLALLMWLVFKVILRLHMFLLYKIEANEINLKRQHIDIFLAFSKVIFFFISFLAVLNLFGIGLSAVLTFGGVGGIIIGFASKDLLSNFAGSMMVYLDGPFSTGDLIYSVDPPISGYVEEINWRVIKIRGLNNVPMYIPSSKFTTSIVENLSRRGNFRIYEQISLCYLEVNAEKLMKAIEDIRNTLIEHKGLSTGPGKTTVVSLSEFSVSSAKMLVYVYTLTNDFSEYCKIKGEIYLAIIKIVNFYGIHLGIGSHIESKGNKVDKVNIVEGLES